MSSSARTADPEPVRRRAHRIRTVVLLGVSCLLLAACGRPEVPPLARATVAPPAVSDPVTPCSAPPDDTPTGTSSPTGVRATYDRGAGTIVLSGGTDVTLAALADAVGEPRALRRTAPGEWLLAANLEVRAGAALRIDAPDVRWLKLRSGVDGFVSLRAVGGRLDVNGSCITSWDEGQGRADVAHQDGRSFLLARDGAQMRIERAQLRYLGYGEVESYGLSWRTEGTGGGITGSVVSDLYFGLYTYGIDGLVVTDNEVMNSVLYGIDPHTGSRNLRIERNRVHDNGKHGIILAEDCTDTVIRDNVVYRNDHHGIVLYQRSDRNVVENNESFDNAAQGININESTGNTVRGNRVYGNEAGIDVGQGSRGTVLDNNDVRANKQDGIRLVTESQQSTLSENVVGENARYGLYVDTDGAFELAGNTIFANRTGLLFKGSEAGSEGKNDVYGNREADVTRR